MMTEECVFPDEDVASIPSHRFNMYGAEVMLVAIMLPKQLSIVAGAAGEASAALLPLGAQGIAC